jgi:predicted acylesterase/phospholipase RssA
MNSNVPPIHNIVLSGGGAKGLSYIGVFQYMEEHDMIKDIRRILGVSMGSIFGLFLTIKMKSMQMKNLVYKVSPTDCMDFNVDSLKIENIIEFFKTMSFDNGNKLVSFIRSCLRVKIGNPDATFADLHNYNPDMDLIILGTELVESKRAYFSYLHTPDFPIAKAVCISCAIPFYFRPVLHEGHIYVDGGVSCNYPIDYFHDDIEHTLGFVFKTDHTSLEAKKWDDLPDFMTYITLITRSFFWSLEKYLYTEYRDYTIFIEAISDDIIVFNIPKETIDKYVASGYSSIDEQNKDRIKRYSKENIEDKEEFTKITVQETAEEIRQTEEINSEMISLKSSKYTF